MIHNISLPPEQFGGPYIEQLFTNKLNADDHPYFREIHELKVSTHLLIRRDGCIIQFVPFRQRAWHAGKSVFRGRERCNDFSIGIELEGSDSQAFSHIQYRQLVFVTALLMQHYPQITADRICGHEHISYQRKTDPGPEFSWVCFFSGLRSIVNNRSR